MPGLNQLKQFNSDILNLGDEVKIRSARGEKPVTVKIPKKITVADDSADFAEGMPFVSEEDVQQAEAAAAEREREKYNVDGLFDDGSSKGKEPAPEAAAAPIMPDVSELLNPGTDFDLSDFEDPAEEEEEEVEEEKVTPIEDMDLDSLLSFSGDGTAPMEDEEEEEEFPASGQPAAEPPADSKEEEEDDFDLASFASAMDPAAGMAEPPAPEASVPEQPSAVPGLADEDGALPEMDDTPAGSDSAAPAADSFDMGAAEADFAASGEELDLTESLPEDLKEEPDPGALAAYEERKRQEEEQAAPETGDALAEEQAFDAGDLAGMDFSGETTAEDEAAAPQDLPALDEGLFSEDAPVADENVAPEEDNAFADMGDLTDLADMGDSPEKTVTDDMQLPDMGADIPAADDSPVADDMQLPDMGDGDDMQLPDMGADIPAADDTISADDMQLPDMGGDDMEGFSKEEAPAPADATESLEAADEGVESFDTSGMDGVDFDAPADAGNDFELGNITAQEGNEEFSIPGFSDTVTANLNKKAPEPEAAPEDGKGEAAPSKPKNTFTDAEYKQFLANLEHYPLNIRLAVELFATKSDFTDDAQFEIFEEVLKKVPAKKLASDLEKLLSDEDLQQLGIQSLSVPKDFERRSNEEWEAYKKTPQYQLKNRILPLAILSTAAAILLFCIWILSDNFLYKPLMARHFYKQGYELVQENMYPQSEDKFNKALTFKSVKDWFYTYAEAYREHKQYDRAENMYRQILRRFKQDKPAGLALADMLANDTFNYPEAEKVLKREVLDYYVNDYDGILQLGDTYLSWADDDPAKFDKAKEQYDLLYELYGGDKKLSPKILSRQMRYYVRTDNLPQVLQYKEGFFPDNKNLGSDDLVEVSGYLLDKRYGDLPPSQEYLRSRIEGLRGLLEAAVKSDPENPTALYNLGRYFVRTDNGAAGKQFFNQAIGLFDSMRPRRARDTYKLIDTYRLLGEQYAKEEKYIDAETQYNKGKELFEKENASNKNFRGTENIGKLYADIADIYYFVSGDMKVALENYVKSVGSENDSPSIRYRIGYIQYMSRNYPEALMSFRLSSEGDPKDTHSLLALANTLSLRDDNYAAQGYYEKLLRILESQRQLYGIMLPQVREDHKDIVETYMWASNNLGVTLSRIADMTGNSKYNAEAIVSLQDSLRAWDALSRNQKTMVRLGGSNLAEQNIKYITEPKLKYSPEIYTYIPMVKSDEEGM